MKRSVGFCVNLKCESYNQGTFRLNALSNTFICSVCQTRGFTEKEYGVSKGSSEIYKEVRVKFNFDPENKVYRETAIVRDESVWGTQSTYTLHSPLIKTERRALKIAEAVLASLVQEGVQPGGAIPRRVEMILSLDDSREKFSHNLIRLGRRWENSPLNVDWKSTTQT